MSNSIQFKPFEQDFKEYKKFSNDPEVSKATTYKTLYSAYLKGMDLYRKNNNNYNEKDKKDHLERSVEFYNMFIKKHISKELKEHLKEFYFLHENEIKANFNNINFQEFINNFILGYTNYYIYYTLDFKDIRHNATYDLKCNDEDQKIKYIFASEHLNKYLNFLENEKLKINSNILNLSIFNYYLQDYSRYMNYLKTKKDDDDDCKKYEKSEIFNHYFKLVHNL